jgi:hypothetical protein
VALRWLIKSRQLEPGIWRIESRSSDSDRDQLCWEVWYEQSNYGLRMVSEGKTIGDALEEAIAWSQNLLKRTAQEVVATAAP